MKKKKYDTSVIMLYLLRQEHLLPSEFRKKIPYSTVSSWRKNACENYEGNQFRFLFDDNWDLVKLKRENKELRSKLRTIARSYLLLKKNLEAFIREQKSKKEFQTKLVEAVTVLRPYIGFELTLKLLFVHRNQFYEWAVASKHNCSHSYSSLCLRRYPRQLQPKEIKKMRYMLSAPKYQHWPIVSIAAHGLRSGSAVASLYSWYKYAKIFDLPHKSFKTPTKQVGLIAERPNEYLHIDTTYYYISKSNKVCITIVMDNFSKMILGFSVGDRLSFDLIRAAVKAALPTIVKHEGDNHSYLVSDGGNENNNSRINEFISAISEHKLSKITALKDIQYSNSPVEAIHKILKGRYLRNKRFETMDGLNHFLEDAVYNYNHLRPHYKHYPKTPGEVYFNTKIKADLRFRVRKVVTSRVKNNLATTCNVCRTSLVALALPFSPTPASDQASLATYDRS